MQEKRETVWLKHPHKGEPIEVDATPEALTPLMAQGYQQYHPGKEAEPPAKGD